MRLPISTDIKGAIDVLVARHPDLDQVYRALQNNYLITINEISFLGGTSSTIPCWKCNINENEIEISAPSGDRTIESFAHELLHVDLDSQGFSESKIVVNWLHGLHDPIPCLFGDQNLIAHINNSLAHFKMHDKFKSFGFSSERFTVDFGSSPVQDAYMKTINSNFYNFGLPNEAIGVYIGQFIGCRYYLNPTFKTDVDNALLNLKTINEDLFWICEDFLNEWESMPVKNNLTVITKFAYSVREWYNRNKNSFTKRKSL